LHPISVENKNVPLGFIQVEKKLNVNNTKKRYDLVVSNPIAPLAFWSNANPLK
jgi:hypothetical protein